MKIKSEIKVALIGLVTLIVLIWGINYLKGINMFNKAYTLHAFYLDSEGLESSAPVLMNGVKIGYIDAIELQPTAALPIHVSLNIDKNFPLKKGTSALLFSADLLGSRAIRLSPSLEEGFLEHNDTIAAAIEADMFSSLSDQLNPVMTQIGGLAESLDSVVSKLGKVLDSDHTERSLQNISAISSSLSASLYSGGSLYESFNNLESFSSMLQEQEDEIASMTKHLNSISEALDSAALGRLAEELSIASGAFTQVLDQVNSGQGSAGKLIYSDSLYNQLLCLLSDLDSLVIDLNENPQDYVRFSLFGK
jgi:phospholipid/cholesterol/gamma-HCH transport system substrate-binding protein